MRHADRPVRTIALPPSTIEYHSVTVDRRDPRASEPLVLLGNYSLGGDNYYARRDGSNPPYGKPISGAIETLMSRKSVAERLATVNRRLRPLDLELYVVDAYRPVECQFGIWDFFWRKFSTEQAELSPRELETLIGQYVSDPRGFDPQDETTWPLHSTGGAVDLTLRQRSTAAPVDLGTHIDDAGERSHTDYFERRLAAGLATESDMAPLHYRRILYWHMIEAGFTNYPHEYWHYDYGDQMYVLMLTRQSSAAAPRAAFYPFIAAEPAA